MATRKGMMIQYLRLCAISRYLVISFVSTVNLNKERIQETEDRRQKTGDRISKTNKDRIQKTNARIRNTGVRKQNAQ
jgi:hypothetical protein